MTDFHSHILPGIDDGSKNIEESIQLLEMMKQQRVETVVATPHFDVDKTTIESFLLKRNEAYEKLRAELQGDFPQIVLGAEVSYYPGIERLDNLSKLCIENTNFLLLEMPVSNWSTSVIESLTALVCRGDINIIIAHIERYYKMQPKQVWNQLISSGVIMQSNASFFIGHFSRRKALKMLCDERIHILGSDCHDLNLRKPNLAQAYSVIENNLGGFFIERIEEISTNLLNNDIF